MLLFLTLFAFHEESYLPQKMIFQVLEHKKQKKMISLPRGKLTQSKHYFIIMLNLPMHVSSHLH